MENSILGRFCLLKFDEMVAILAQMDDATANLAPDVPGANSPFQILTHCLGMLQQWTRESILGEPVQRDREAELTATGRVDALVERAGVVRAEFVRDLARIVPGQKVWGRPGRHEFWADDAQGILLHVLEELSQHLGQLEITRDCLPAAPPRIC